MQVSYLIANRGYAEILNKRFFPTDRGKLISAFLEKLFSKYVDYKDRKSTRLNSSHLVSRMPSSA